MLVTVKWFAASRDASGTDQESILVTGDKTLGELVQLLGSRSEQLEKILQISTFLVDSHPTCDLSLPLYAGAIVEVLPPFAGG